MEQLEIRPYQQGDWQRLQEIHDPARKEELRLAGLDAAFVPLSAAAEREGLFDYTVEVAAVDGRAVGFVAWCQEELAWLYVDTALQGRGIGTALVRHVLEVNTRRPMAIEVLEGNAPARRLYEKQGFVLRETAQGHMPGREEFFVRAWVLELE